MLAKVKLKSPDSQSRLRIVSTGHIYEITIGFECFLKKRQGRRDGFKLFLVSQCCLRVRPWTDTYIM